MNEVVGKIIRASLTRDIRYYLLLHRSYICNPPLWRRCKTSAKNEICETFFKIFANYFKSVFFSQLYRINGNTCGITTARVNKIASSTINGSQAIGKPTETARKESTRNHKVSSRMHHRIKIYKYSGALTRITCTGARPSIRLNGSNTLSAIYVAHIYAYIFYPRFKILYHCRATYIPYLSRKYAKSCAYRREIFRRCIDYMRFSNNTSLLCCYIG